MPEPLVHFIIPFFLLLVVGINIKRAALLSSLALLPDFDILFHIHRSFSHSIFFILLITIPVTVVIKKYYKEHFNDAIIATLVILSHLFMDSFDNYTPVLWPLFNESIRIVTELTINMNNVTDLNFNFNIDFKPIVFYQTKNMDAPIFSSMGFAVSVMLLAGMALKHILIKPPSSRP